MDNFPHYFKEHTTHYIFLELAGSMVKRDDIIIVKASKFDLLDRLMNLSWTVCLPGE